MNRPAGTGIAHHTTISPWLSVADATSAVAFYRTALGAETGEVAEFDGIVEVAELSVDGAPFWVQRDLDLPTGADPGRTVRMIISVTDPDAAFGRAIDAGATELAGVHEANGWRTGRVADPFGHQWEFARRA